MEIPYIALCRGMFGFSPTKRTMLTMRACAQSQVKSNADLEFEGMKVVVGGTCADYKLGKLALGKKMESSIKLALTYIKIQIEDDTVLELDKLNEVFIVNNEDMLATIKSKC
jgi:hypothetical protein